MAVEDPAVLDVIVDVVSEDVVVAVTDVVVAVMLVKVWVVVVVVEVEVVIVVVVFVVVVVIVIVVAGISASQSTLCTFSHGTSFQRPPALSLPEKLRTTQSSPPAD